MTDKAQPLVSVLINNRNYGCFLSESIESALGQNYPNIEVIVVDDGSSDASDVEISVYADRVRAVMKVHGGQASALNAGFKASRGEILCFLDADDVYYPGKVEQVVGMHRQVGVGRAAMISHRLRHFGLLSSQGYAPTKFWHIKLGRQSGTPLAMLCTPGLAYEYARERSFVPYLAAPTSGISITRKLADRVFPLPEVHRVGADCLLARAAILAGNAYGTEAVLAGRRIHHRNHSMHEHEHLSDEVFLSAMDVYLNNVLQQQGREPVISFFESTSAEGFQRARRSCSGLLRLALKVYRRNRSMRSLRFAARACRLAAHVAGQKYVSAGRAVIDRRRQVA